MIKLTSAFIAMIFIMVFFPSRTMAQTIRSGDENVAIELYNRTTNEYYTYYAKLERMLTTPSGNFLRTVSLNIGQDEPIMNFSGPRKIFEVKMQYDIDGDGTDEDIVDTMAVLTRSGNLKFVYHYNGAGNRLPRGWDF